MLSGSNIFSESKSYNVLFCVLIVVLLCSFELLSAEITTNDVPSILILHSYHSGFTWTDNISVGLLSVLNEVDFEIDIHIEYMDTKFYPPDLVYPLLEQLYMAKYKSMDFDVIITTDDNALGFLLARRNQLFPHVPIVFCGLNNYSDSRIEGISGITGVAEAFDLGGTLEQALKLHPGTHYIAVINDVTPTGIMNLEQFRNIEHKFVDRIEFIKLFDLTAEELREALHALPDETVVLLLSFYRDRSGRTFSYSEYTEFVTNISNAPVYTAWDMFVGHGVVGGIVTSGKAQGEHAAQMAIRVLNGESADKIPVLTESPNVPMFDFNVMQHFGISTSDLPPGSVVINEYKSLYCLYKVYIWIVITFVLLQSALILALTINVLRRRRAEESLKQSELHYRGIVEDQTEFICRYLPDGTLTFVNEAYCRYFEQSHYELLGQKYISFIADEDSQIVQNYLAILGRENPVETHEYRIITPEGELRWNQWTNRAIFDTEGEVVEFQGVGHDINERKQAEESLRKAEVRYRTLVEQMLAITYTAVLDKSRKITFISPQIELFLGISPNDCVDNPDFWNHHLHPDDCDRVLKEIEYCHKTKESFCSEYRMISKKGKIVWFRDEAIIIRNDDGVPLFFQGIMIDITKHKSAEQKQLSLERQILHVQKLESMGVLASGIAHDFNNLLTGILGNADLALLKLSQVSPVRQNIQGIETAARQAAELCREMLDYSGKERFVSEQVDLSEIIREMSHILDISISKKVVIKYNLADIPVVIKADPSQIRQVIMNLITNASEAIGEKSGVISIYTGLAYYDRVQLLEVYMNEELTEGMYASLEVSDTGCGMSEVTKGKLFDPFFTTKHTGRGLGLASVLGIIRGHAGTISLYSELEKGTTFKILIPAVGGFVKHSVEEESGLQEWKGHGTILLVDDEETVRGVARNMIEYLGFNVITAENGQEAVEIFKARQGEIDCIVLDLTMPIMNGEEAFYEIRKINNDVRVILCSGYNKKKISKQFMSKGLSGIIQKPYILKMLRKVLREALEGICD